MDGLYDAVVDHLEEDQPGGRIDGLVRRRLVDLVVHPLFALPFLDRKVPEKNERLSILES